MTPITIRPTRANLSVANAISSHTGPRTERDAEFLTWGADEHILCVLAAGWWLYCRGKNTKARRASDHILLTKLVSSGLPHILKVVFDQERPDRRTVEGHWRGVPFSGKRLDAFPSGHAMHIGALASAASTLPASNAMYLEHRRRVGSDAGCTVGALGERCWRGPCCGRCHRTATQIGDGLPASASSRIADARARCSRPDQIEWRPPSSSA
jgi:hypothetical protein